MSLTDTAALRKMSVDERLQILEAVWDSLAADPDAIDVPQWHKDELDRRLAEEEQNPDAGAPWDEVKARLLDES